MPVFSYGEFEYLHKDVPLWRYFDFDKFMDMLETSTLFFCPFKSFEDKFDGVHNAFEEDDYYDITDKGELIPSKQTNSVRVLENTAGLRNYFLPKISLVREFVGVSCWRQSEDESHAMWKAFVTSKNGVAIKTTMARIESSIQLEQSQFLMFGSVNYIDLKTQKVPIQNVFDAAYHKSRHFVHESEARILYYSVNNPLLEPFSRSNLLPLPTPGYKMKIDCNVFIQEIVVSPYASDWFFQLVKSVANKKYGLTADIKPSQILIS